jgi:hypothetical protein
MKDSLIELAWRFAGISTFLSRVVAGMGMGRKGTYLSASGWYRSFQRRLPIDAADDPIPWYSYPVIRFLRDRIQPEMKVFEYGCGHSTLWWSERVSQVVFCEHDCQWFDRIHGDFGERVTGHIKSPEDGSYADFIRNYSDAFDIIVIDGMERVECARRCLGALKKGGVIIWDNSDRDIYQEGFDFLAEAGFRRIDFAGLGPIVMIPTETAVFYKPDNCLGI